MQNLLNSFRIECTENIWCAYLRYNYCFKWPSAHQKHYEVCHTACTPILPLCFSSEASTEDSETIATFLQPQPLVRAKRKKTQGERLREKYYSCGTAPCCALWGQTAVKSLIGNDQIQLLWVLIPVPKYWDKFNNFLSWMWGGSRRGDCRSDVKTDTELFVGLWVSACWGILRHNGGPEGGI